MKCKLCITHYLKNKKYPLAVWIVHILPKRRLINIHILRYIYIYSVIKFVCMAFRINQQNNSPIVINLNLPLILAISTPMFDGPLYV